MTDHWNKPFDLESMFSGSDILDSKMTEWVAYSSLITICNFSVIFIKIWYFGVILKHTGRWKNIQLYKWIVWNWKMTIEGNECQKYSLSCVLSKKPTIYRLIMCWSKISLIQLFKRFGTTSSLFYAFSRLNSGHFRSFKNIAFTIG